MSATHDSTSPPRLSRRDFLSTSITTVSAVGLGACRSLRTSDPTPDVPSAPGDVSRAIEALRRSIPRTMARQDIPGLSIALVQRGDVVWTEGFGVTDRDRRTPVRSDTQFSIGSISKSFTTLGVLRAVEQGQLSLDEPLQTYLPWFTLSGELGRSAANKITLRHLLSHHAGLGTWAPLGNPYDSEYHARTFDEVVRSTRNSRLKFMPGERFEYSNQGIDLAGATLATIRGKPFARCMQEDVLDPLGMAASTFDQGVATTRPAYATPHSGRRRVPIKNGVVHPMLAAGGMISTAPDLARFLAFHRDEGRIGGQAWIRAALLGEVHTPQFSAREQPTGYGLAMYKAIEHDAVRFSHGGFGFGTSAHYRWLPEHDFGVVVLTNQDAAHNGPAIAGEAVALLLGRDPRASAPRSKVQQTTSRAPMPSSASGASPRAVAGSYVLYEGILETFEADDERLYHVRGRQRTPLRAAGGGEFFGEGRRYIFASDADGRLQGVRIVDVAYDVATTENSVLYLGRNDAPTDTPGPNPSEWASLTGRYVGTFVGAPTEAELRIKNGYLYLNRTLRLKAVEPGLFITGDNEEVRVDRRELFVGNRRYAH